MSDEPLLSPRVDWGAIAAGSNLSEFGGYKTPIELVEAFEAEVRFTFPMNGVPPSIVVMVQEMKRDARKLSSSMHTLSEAMMLACAQHHPVAPAVVVHKGFGSRGGPLLGTMCGQPGVMSPNDDDTNCPACMKVLADTSHRG